MIHAYTILCVGRNPDPQAGIMVAEGMGLDPRPLLPVMGNESFEVEIDDARLSKEDIDAMLQKFRDLGYEVEERP